MAGALKAVPRERFDAVLANPPFGKKSSTMIVGESTGVVRSGTLQHEALASGIP